ncbi:unnamed protein product [Amoebophrya sp. A25]|nr:unnamed protein product [Amoebophrya sp. A25]|eukprot:GSA25T00013169001.1
MYGAPKRTNPFVPVVPLASSPGLQPGPPLRVPNLFTGTSSGSRAVFDRGESGFSPSAYHPSIGSPSHAGIKFLGVGGTRQGLRSPIQERGAGVDRLSSVLPDSFYERDSNQNCFVDAPGGRNKNVEDQPKSFGEIIDEDEPHRALEKSLCLEGVNTSPAPSQLKAARHQQNTRKPHRIQGRTAGTPSGRTSGTPHRIQQNHAHAPSRQSQFDLRGHRISFDSVPDEYSPVKLHGGGRASIRTKMPRCEELTDDEHLTYGNRWPHEQLTLGKGKLLGRGGCALVWQGLRGPGDDECRFAVKQVAKQQLQRGELVPVKAGQLQGLLQELEILQRLTGVGDHDHNSRGGSSPSSAGSRHVVRLEAFVEGKTDLWIVMEDGGAPISKSLFEVKGEFVNSARVYRVNHGPLMQRMRLPKDDNFFLRDYFRQMLSAFAFLASEGIIHADVKPENILLSSTDGRLRLCDFGSAWVVGETAASSAVGTPEYMAPEILDKQINWSTGGSGNGAPMSTAQRLRNRRGSLDEVLGNLIASGRASPSASTAASSSRSSRAGSKAKAGGIAAGTTYSGGTAPRETYGTLREKINRMGTGTDQTRKAHASVPRGGSAEFPPQQLAMLLADSEHMRNRSADPGAEVGEGDHVPNDARNPQQEPAPVGGAASSRTATSTSDDSSCFAQDLWALGMILLEVCHGVPLWLGYECCVGTSRTQGLLGAGGRDYKKIRAKQTKVLKNLQPLLKNQSFGVQLATVRDGVEFLQSLLRVDPRARISAREALRHPFITGGC